MWFRVLLGTDGTIRTCKLVEQALQNSQTIIYVDAPNKEAACIAAKKAYASDYNRELSVQKAAAGECRTCTREAIEGERYCSTCKVELKLRVTERKAVRDAAGVQPGERLPAVFKVRRAPADGRAGYGRNKRKQRHATLTDVRKAYLDKSHAAFRTWLNNEIAKVAPVPTTQVAYGGSHLRRVK